MTGCSENAGVLLDYGTEISGTVRIMVFGVNSGTGRADLHIRFGESVSEALSDLGEKNSCCDHANRDEMINVGFLSANETNETGFRFIYLELTGEDVSVSLKAVQAVFIFRILNTVGALNAVILLSIRYGRQPLIPLILICRNTFGMELNGTGLYGRRYADGGYDHRRLFSVITILSRVRWILYAMRLLSGNG